MLYSTNPKSLLPRLSFICAAVAFSLPVFAEQPVYLDTDRAMDERIDDLLSRLTLDEKAELMKNESVGVSRLGIPAYDWWNEALHGVARAGEATVFPQAIGLAAMWDEEEMLKVADVISTEARAKHHEFVRNGIRDRYTGLTFWSPNINIFRDPRWGRGQETYGEDPYLTGRMGLSFVKGLQGDDPNYLKTAATAKHFAVHSGPEANRYSFNADPTAADFHETYLPAFETLIREGKVEAVMSAYNALYNVPTTMNPVLYDILDQWDFDGHVVSDCGAVYCIFEKFGLARDYTEAEALAVQAGLCLRCGDGEANLAEAVRRGLISVEMVDEQLFKLMRTWFRLGLFDPAERVPYAQIPFSANDTPANSQVALEAAERSIVLLKNEGVLPLQVEDLERILVVGPNANSIPVLLGNYNGTPSRPTTILDALRSAFEPQVEIDFIQGCDYVATPPGLRTLPRVALVSGDFSTATDGDLSGLIGSIYANSDLQGAPVETKRSHQIEFDWSGSAPAPGLDAKEFSARWTGLLSTVVDGEYELVLEGNGAVRLILGDEIVVDEWVQGEKTISVSRMFAGNALTPLTIEYSHVSNSAAKLHLKWQIPPADASFADAVARAKKSDVVIFVGGISAQLEGEDMRVDYEGFASGDRTVIELPTIQQDLAEELAATGKPLVFVNLSGSAMAFESVDAVSSAIVQAWYPGQNGGQALAKLLTGEVNPAARLPLTFYQSTKDLPAFDDYRMAGRTYRYFDGEPLYAFGHGLSYTDFKYSKLKVNRADDGGIEISLKVRNVGEVDGDEVAQAYLIPPVESAPRERRTLGAFKRVNIPSGESREVVLKVQAKQLKRWNEEIGLLDRVTGAWTVEVGAASDDIRSESEVLID